MTHTSAASHPQDPHLGDISGVAPVILIGLDGSPSSWDAFSWAAGEATRGHGQLVAVLVQPAIAPYAAFGAPFDYAAAQQANDEVAEKLHDEADRRARDLGVPLHFVRQVGDSAIALTRVADLVHADLIVVGRSAKMLHHLAGSLGRRLVSRHDAPAIVVVP